MSEFNVDEHYAEYGDELTLFEYQKDAVEFMVTRYLNGKGTILADTMGLGKTKEVATVISCLSTNHVLVIVPNVLLFQWLEELFTTCSFYNVYYCKSQKIQKVTMDENGEFVYGAKRNVSHFAELEGNNIMICNYHAVVPYPKVESKDGITGSKRELNSSLDAYIPEFTPFNDIEWDLVVADEVHTIRNGVSTSLDRGVSSTKTLTFYRCSRLRMKEGGSRIGMTGTPIQNKIGDMVSILKFVGAPFPVKTRITQEKLHEIIGEYMFRRTDKDLHPDLVKRIRFPEDEYESTDILIEYRSEEERELYALVSGMAKEDDMKTDIKEVYDVHQEESKLLETSMLTYLSSDINMFIRIYNKIHDTDFPFWEGTNSKHDTTAELLEINARENRSVIVFVHFYEEVDGIMEAIQRLEGVEDLGEGLGYNYYSLDGRNKLDEKRAIIQNTRDDVASGQRCVFFTTIKTSGAGLNLPHFNVGIFPSADWNPGNEIQAIMRMHRIGQEKKVSIYRLLYDFVIPKEIRDNGHIDSYITKVKTLKENKFDIYVNTEFNAARKWPVRNLEGTEEPSVIWREVAPDEELGGRLEKLGLKEHADIKEPQREGRVNIGLTPRQRSVNSLTKLQSTKAEPKRKYGSGHKLDDSKTVKKPQTIEEIRALRLKALEK